MGFSEQLPESCSGEGIGASSSQGGTNAHSVCVFACKHTPGSFLSGVLYFLLACWLSCLIYSALRRPVVICIPKANGKSAQNPLGETSYRIVVSHNQFCSHSNDRPPACGPLYSSHFQVTRHLCRYHLGSYYSLFSSLLGLSRKWTACTSITDVSSRLSKCGELGRIRAVLHANI